MHGVCLYEWQPDGCAWTVQSIWQSRDPLVRADLAILALLLACVVILSVQAAVRLNLAKRTDQRLPYGLVRQVNALKSIATVAPMLGLAGTCLGILSALFVGYSMSRGTALALISTGVATSLFTTAAGMLVAIPASVSYNYLLTQVEALRASNPAATPRRDKTSLHYRFAEKLPLGKRFATLPAFSLIAAFTFASLIGVFMTVSDKRAQGLEVGVVSGRCEFGLADRLLVLRVTKEGKLFLNNEAEDWKRIGARLSDIYRMREERTLYLVGDEDVQFQMVADAIDIVRTAKDPGNSAPLAITLKLITPAALSTVCPQPAIVRSKRNAR